MIIEISVALIAVCFAVLVGFLITAIQSAKASLKQVNDTLAQIDQKTDTLSEETVKLMQTAHQIADDVQGKLKSADALFQSVGQVGESVHQLTSSVKQVSATVSDTVRRAGQKVGRETQTAEMMEWVSLGLHLWRRWQARKSQNEQSSKAANERNDNDV